MFSPEELLPPQICQILSFTDLFQLDVVSTESYRFVIWVETSPNFWIGRIEANPTVVCVCFLIFIIFYCVSLFMCVLFIVLSSVLVDLCKIRERKCNFSDAFTGTDVVKLFFRETKIGEYGSSVENQWPLQYSIILVCYPSYLVLYQCNAQDFAI